MSDFKTRLIQERDELQEKYQKLSLFIFSDAFKTVSEVQQLLLQQQYSHMYGYLSVLNQRLENL